jgi:hypothetical protein
MFFLVAILIGVASAMMLACCLTGACDACQSSSFRFISFPVRKLHGLSRLLFLRKIRDGHSHRFEGVNLIGFNTSSVNGIRLADASSAQQWCK